MSFLFFVLVGLCAGFASGLFGIGGGVIIVPALALLAAFSQERAVGTSLAALLLPVSLAAVWEYYRGGNVDLRGAVWVALGMVAGAWLGALLGLRAGEARMKLAFGVFMMALGAWMVVTAIRGAHTPMHE